MSPWTYALALPPAAVLGWKAFRRLQVSLAKHPSLRGHPKFSRRLAKRLRGYRLGEEAAFGCDAAPQDVIESRRAGFRRLSEQLRARSPQTLERSRELAESLPDAQFTAAYRVPFPYRDLVREHLPAGTVLAQSRGVEFGDLDDDWAYDLTGSYGVNVLGNDSYKAMLARAEEKARELGPVLGSYHPVMADNAKRLAEISGHPQVSFHMSGTEAVMQAVGLARYHTGRPRVVKFTGAYHGWWDGVQNGVGSHRRNHDTYTFKEMDAATLRVLRTRKDIACVLVNPLQALNPNGGPASDASLLGAGKRSSAFDKAAYSTWLQELRQVCTERGIALILDEVFLGFRLAKGGAQEYFGVRADLVTYGKTLGGGLPVGVICGSNQWMARFREDRPTDICFARGTFNSHPYVLTAMNEFLRTLDDPETVERIYGEIDRRWDARAARWNERLLASGHPIQVRHMTSVFTVQYTEPSRFHWMYRYYLEAEGLRLPWTGTGRLIFSHNYTEGAFDEVIERSVRAADRMAADGWWWRPAGLTRAGIRRQILRELVKS